MDKKTQFLPLTAPVKSVGNTDWVRVWMQLRRSEHLEAAEGKPLLPGPQEGGTWSSVPLSASSAALWLRSLLDGAEGPPIAEVGTHSLKATCLSWCSKYGMELSMRRALGYHHTAADRSVNTYARDAMAAPLRCLQEVITSIVDRKFFQTKLDLACLLMRMNFKLPKIDIPENRLNPRANHRGTRRIMSLGETRRP